MPIDDRYRKMLMMDYATKNQGEGFLGTKNQSGLFGNLANINPNLLIGSNIFGAGIKGQDPFSPIMPSVLQAAKIQSALKGKRKTKQVQHKVTGEKSWATEEMISNDSNLIPVTTPMFEDAESKYIGTTYGKDFENIKLAADTALAGNETLTLMKELIKLPDLKTGQFGQLRTSVEKTLNEFGISMDLQNASAADVLNSIQGKLVLEGLANFKGAISDKEREFLQNIYPGLSLTKRGNEVLIDLTQRLNNRTIALSDSMENWRSTYGKLSAKNADGDTWNQWKSKWYKNNPLVTDDEREEISSLQGSVDDAFTQNQGIIIDETIIKQFPNLKDHKGKKFVVINGKPYIFRD